MFGNHKIIQITNIWFVSTWKKIHGKNEAFGFQNQSKQGMHCNSSKWTIKLLHLNFHHLDLVLTK
jgi:hypothetical protein